MKKSPGRCRITKHCATLPMNRWATKYPDSYLKFFGPNYVPPDYIRVDAEAAREHRWYMSARLITLYDIYFFEKAAPIDPDFFEDIVGRNFRQPGQGLGFDGSTVAHMWRTAIWPNNAL